MKIIRLLHGTDSRQEMDKGFAILQATCYTRTALIAGMKMAAHVAVQVTAQEIMME